MCTAYRLVDSLHYEGCLPLAETGSGEGCGCNMIWMDPLWDQKVTVVRKGVSEDGRQPTL